MFGISFIVLIVYQIPNYYSVLCLDSKLCTNFELTFFQQKSYSTNIQVSKANVKLNSFEFVPLNALSQKGTPGKGL